MESEESDISLSDQSVVDMVVEDEESPETVVVPYVLGIYVGPTTEFSIFAFCLECRWRHSRQWYPTGKQSCSVWCSKGATE